MPTGLQMPTVLADSLNSTSLLLAIGRTWLFLLSSVRGLVYAPQVSWIAAVGGKTVGPPGVQSCLCAGNQKIWRPNKIFLALPQRARYANRVDCAVLAAHRVVELRQTRRDVCAARSLFSLKPLVCGGLVPRGRKSCVSIKCSMESTERQLYQCVGTIYQCVETS